jgi:penicillin amidase/acyl-homoserine-lactone acylase
MRYLKISAFVLLVLIAGAAVFLIVVPRLDQPAPPDMAVLIAKVRQYNARIQRDNFGVPHVSGPRDADARSTAWAISKPRRNP